MLYWDIQSTCFEDWKHNILQKVGSFREIRNPCGGEGGGAKNNNAIIFKFFSKISSSFPLFVSALLPAAFVVLATSQMKEGGEKRNSSDKITRCKSTTKWWYFTKWHSSNSHHSIWFHALSQCISWPVDLHQEHAFQLCLPKLYSWT